MLPYGAELLIFVSLSPLKLPKGVFYLLPALNIAKSTQLRELLLLLRLRVLLTRSMGPSHDEVVDIVIVDFRTIVDSWVRDVASDVVDDVCHNLAILLGHGGCGLLNDVLGRGSGLFGICMGLGLSFWLVLFVNHWLRTWPSFLRLLRLSL